MSEDKYDWNKFLESQKAEVGQRHKPRKRELPGGQGPTIPFWQRKPRQPGTEPGYIPSQPLSGSQGSHEMKKNPEEKVNDS